MNAQNKPLPKVSSISEIIFPASANIRNNFNLFYEIHLSRTTIPQPSFWYKVTFNKKCSFKFNLFSLIESDRYDFYLFKIAGNQSFCDALANNKLEVCDAERENRIYTNQEQSTEFRAGLINVKAVEVEAGDAIYLEVFNLSGNDCGHVLDFQTDDNSFVVKMINDNCANNQNQINNDSIVSYQPIIKEHAFSIFNDLLCNPKQKLTNVSSIKMSTTKVEVKNKLDLNSYIKAQPIKYVPKIENKPAVIKENVKTPPMVVQPKVEPLIIAINNRKVQKSTADLNNISELHRNATKLEVDNVLFKLLSNELAQKIRGEKLNQQQLVEELKKTSKNNKEKRMALNDELKDVKQHKIELANKMKEVEFKIKQITRLLEVEYAKNNQQESNFAFNKSVDNNNSNSLGFAKSVFVQGLVYRIQVGAYKNSISEDIFKGLSPIYGESFTDGIRYSVGSFAKLNDAKEAKNYVVEKGLTDAFVIAYNNGKKLPIAAAMKLQEMMELNNK